MKEGDSVILDKNFINTSEVTVVRLGKLISRVRDDEKNEWEVMTYRLTPIQNPVNPVNPLNQGICSAINTK